MRNMRIGIHMLLLIQDRHTAKCRLRPLVKQLDLIIITRQAIGQGNAIDHHIRLGLLLYEQRRETGRRITTLLQIIIIERGSFAHEDLNNLIGQETHRIDAVIADQQFSLRTGFHNHQYPTIRHQVNIAPEDIHQLDRPLDSNTLRHINHKTILSEHRIQSDNTIL